MSNLSERASYLKGLADGMNLNPDKNANRLLLELIDLVADTATALDELEMDHEVMADLVEAIDEDVSELEEELSDMFDRPFGAGDRWEPEEDDEDDPDFFEDEEDGEEDAEPDDGEEDEAEEEDEEPETEEDEEAEEDDAGSDDAEDEPEEAEEEEESRADDDEDAVLYSCPHCGREVKLDLADLDFDEDMPCPKCGKPLFPETLDDLEDGEFAEPRDDDFDPDED